MKRRLINTVNLVFFQDESHGEWGVTHKETCDIDYGFNAFWSGIGIFHDVFEHWHEHKHKYFKGNYAMNLGGEMAAMGAMWYFVDELGLGSIRRLNPVSIYSDAENMRLTTEREIQEAIYSGSFNFGNTLESDVPYQPPVYNDTIEYTIEEMVSNVKAFKFNENEYSSDSEREFSNNYKQSVTFGKVANLHRWGFRQAERMVPNTSENWNALRDFIDFWNKFTKNNDAKELATYFTGIEFKIYREGDKVSWRAKLIGEYGVPDTKVTSPYPIMEDIYSSIED